MKSCVLYRVSGVKPEILWVKVVYRQPNPKVLWHLTLRQTVNGIKGKIPTEELLETADSNY
jgi:hypothetical protein